MRGCNTCAISPTLKVYTTVKDSDIKLVGESCLSHPIETGWEMIRDANLDRKAAEDGYEIKYEPIE